MVNECVRCVYGSMHEACMKRVGSGHTVRSAVDVALDVCEGEDRLPVAVLSEVDLSWKRQE